MSLFQDDTSKIEKAVAYFNSLEKQRQALLVSDMYGDDWNTEDVDELCYIIFTIQDDMSKYSAVMMVRKLVELGMEETFAWLIVNNTIKEFPTDGYQHKVLSKIDDEQFKKLFPELFNAKWVELNDLKVIKKNLGISDEELQSMISVINVAMEFLAQRRTTEKILAEQFKKNGLSDSKIEVMLNTFKINSEFWRNKILYSRSYDTTDRILGLIEQNNTIIRLVKEMLEISKQSQQETDVQTPYQ